MRLPAPAALLVGALLVTACGGAAATPADTAAPPATGMCAPGVADCVDTVVEDGGDDEFDSEQARENARAQLGLAEAELAPDVRISRRGDEQMFLTEDYQLGRLTVELDPDPDGTFVVTKVTVELPEGPETFGN